MKTNQTWRIALFLLLVVLLASCKKNESTENLALLELAEQGKILYKQYQCAKCHTEDRSAAKLEAANVAPDLSDPFLANDSQFVKVHLSFMERTVMPPINLSAKEIDALSHYVAQLHRDRHPGVPEEQADAYCPVCYAPVSSQEATKKNLVVLLGNDKFYFECGDCQAAFVKAPKAFIELLRQYHSNLSVVTIPK